MVCLPCGISNNQNVERHCMCCSNCMRNLILNAKMEQKHVSCPICQYEFDPNAVEKALNTGCLVYPDERYAPRLVEWYPDENEEKRNCLKRVASHDQRCMSCHDYFSTENPLLCLPCAIAPDGKLTRHCRLCKRCTEGLIASNENISCPSCDRVFDARALRKAMDSNCLNFPEKRRHQDAFTGWDAYEVEPKRLCLQDLHLNAATGKRAPLSAAEITDRLPRIVSILKDSHPTITRKNLQQFESLFVPEPETYVGSWNMQYTNAVDRDPFPENLTAVLSGPIGPPPPIGPPAMRRVRAATVNPAGNELYHRCSMSLHATIAILSTLRNHHGDDDKLHEHCPAGYPRHSIKTYTGTADVMKALVYGHMFSTDSGAREMPKEAVTWAHNHLKPLILDLDSNDEGQSTMQSLKTTLWIVMGRALITMLFQILDPQTRR